MNDRPLTVAMVAGMPYLTAKASVIRVANIVRSLAARYPELRVQVFAYRGDTDDAARPNVTLHLVEGFDADKNRYYAWSNKLAADARLIRALIGQRREIDLLHCHTIEGLAIALTFKVLTLSRAPICVDVHGPIVAELVHYKLIPPWRPVIAAAGALERLMLRRAAHAFVSNEGLKTLLGTRMPASRVSVVFDYVDAAVFDRERIDPCTVAALTAKYKSRGERLITFIGMFKDYQGVDYLIRAFEAVAARDPGLRLLLVGDGPCREEYLRLIERYRLQERVALPGLIAHDRIIDWLEISDIVVSPRVDNEITQAGFVSQMPEYMAAGKLIVSTWVSGCRYLLRDGAGILVEPNDVEALRAGLERALQLTPAERSAYAANARRNVAQFTWREGIRTVHDVYRAIRPAAAS